MTIAKIWASVIVHSFITLTLTTFVPATANASDTKAAAKILLLPTFTFIDAQVKV